MSNESRRDADHGATRILKWLPIISVVGLLVVFPTAWGEQKQINIDQSEQIKENKSNIQALLQMVSRIDERTKITAEAVKELLRQFRERRD